MFARVVSIRLKSDTVSDYTHTFEAEILPLLRKQKGFKDELALSNPNSQDFVAISLWDNKTDAEAYNTNTYPSVLKISQGMIEGTPTVQTFEVVNSTFHKLAVAA
jgi:heme-degrading monooxygenase HmoA